MTGIDLAEALGWIECQQDDIPELFARALRTREQHRGRHVQLCAIVNAKSGGCGDDCGFCAQSSHHAAQIQSYPMRSAGELFEAAAEAAGWGVRRFSLVTSGRAVSRDVDVQPLVDAVERIDRDLPVLPCASLGRVRRDVLTRLRDAGLTRYHCNLETAESHFGNVCTTRRYSDTYDTLLDAREAGLSLCCGGIFGLGEAPVQRVELLAKIRELDVDSVPLNFLHPILGTPLAGIDPIRPVDCLKAVAVARLMMPDRQIRICGGREHNLRDLQSWLLMAGADGLMVGNYLTTAGRSVADDLQMIADADLQPAPQPGPVR